MKKRKSVSKREVLLHMMELASHPLNDAVRLAFLSEEPRDDIATLDLCGLSEFKRNANGTVEVKFTDRLAVLQSLLDRMEEEESLGAMAFLQALESEEGHRAMEVSRR